MEILRRSFLISSSAAVLVLALGADDAQARLHGGVASGITPPSGQITTITLSNTSGSSETPMWSRVFGLAFPDSDTTGCPLSSGNPTYPKFVSGVTTLPYSMSVNPSYYPSGRLMHATFVLLLGTNITLVNNATADIAVNQTNNTSLPSASSRALSDFSVADIQHLVTGMDNLSGNWVASLNDGVSSAFADNYVWLDGPAGKMWRIRADYKQSGTAEGNLTSYVYCFSGQNPGSGFGGMRFQWCMATPWVDATVTLRDWKSFSAMTLQTGGTVIRDNVTSGRTNTGAFTWASFTDFNCAGNTFETYQACRLTTTGTLPGGTTTGQTYFISNGPFYTPPYSQFDLLTSPTSSAVVGTSAGTGTHTITTYPWIACYSKLFMCASDAQWDFVQGGGSFTPPITYRDTQVTVQFDRAYLRSTELIPSFDFSPATTAGALMPFYINTCCGLYKFPDGGGQNDGHIGIVPSYYANHTYTQAQSDETNVRAIGLTSGQMGSSLRNLGNGGTIQAWNNGTGGTGTPYSGMGSLLSGQVYAGFNGSTAFPPNSAIAVSNVLWGGTQNIASWPHRTQFCLYPYLITGQPEYLDMLIEQANMAPGTQFNPGTTTAQIDATTFSPRGNVPSVGGLSGSRNVTVGAKTYYAMVFLGDQIRAQGWIMGTFMPLAGIIPTSFPECPAYKTYFNDVVNDNLDYALDCTALLFGANSYANANHPFLDQTYFQDFWQEGYFVDGVALGYGYLKNVKALTLCQYVADWAAHCVNTFGINFLNFEENLIRSSSAFSNNGPYITSDDLLGVQVVVDSWTNGNNFIVLDDPTAAGWAPQINDSIVFTSPNPPSQATTPCPGAMTYFTRYWVVGVGGTSTAPQIQLSVTQGGSAITMTDSSSNAINAFYRNAVPNTTLASGQTATGNANSLIRAMYMAKSRGVVLDSSFETAIDGSVLAPTAGNFAGNLQWCLGKIA